MAQSASNQVKPSSPPSRKRKHSTISSETPDAQTEIEIDVSLPEPPSKKDLRKLKKLKSKGVDTDTLASLNVQLIDRSNKGAQEGETPAGTTGNAAKRSPYAVWIGNLSFSTTRDDLIEFFTKGSEGETDIDGENESTGLRKKDITRIHIPKSTKFPKQNKGFAYVDFTTAKCLSQALSLSEKLFNGRKVLIKASTDFAGRPEEDTKKQKKDSIDSNKNPPSRSIFVGNLGYEVTENDLYAHFSPAGNIKKVRFMSFEDSGKCKGFSWVDYEELKSAENVFAGRIEGAEEDTAESSSDGEDEEGSPKKKIKVTGKKDKKKKEKLNPYTFMGSRRLRLEYGEDATTRYKKRHGTDSKPRDIGEDTGESTEYSKGGRPGRHRKEERPLTSEEKIAKKVESRLTGRIVEGTGKKINFD